MRNWFSQHKRICIKLTGFVIIPAVLISSYFIFHMETLNFTGVINNPVYGTFMKLPCLILWIYLNMLCYQEVQIPYQKHWFLITGFFAIGALALPYTSPAALCSNLHVFFCNIAFFLFNAMILYSVLSDPKKLTVYFLLCCPSFLLCLFSMSVTGIAEIAYTIGITFYLTLFSQ